MAITTAGFYQKNIDHFSRLNKDVSDIQLQVSTGKKTLSLKHDVQDIALLNASEEHKKETAQFNNNAGRVISDLEKIDISFEQLQNAAIRLKELQVESSNGLLTAGDRKLFQLEIAAIKEEIITISNGQDASGNGYFSGTSTETKPFKVNNFGEISYDGSMVSKSLQVSRDTNLRQNFSGAEVFLSVNSASGKFSIFEAIDEFSQSLDHGILGGISSNLLSKGNAVDLVFPVSGQTNQYKFDLIADGSVYKIDANVYGNDFNGLVGEINSNTSSTGISAIVSADNKITFSGANVELKIANFTTDLPTLSDKTIGVQKTVGSNVNDEIILPNSLSKLVIRKKIDDVFDHLISMRAELGIAANSAQNYVDSTQNTLIDLSEGISQIEDADMAELLTEMQKLLTNKEAAQATFSRLSSKNLFDFFG